MLKLAQIFKDDTIIITLDGLVELGDCTQLKTLLENSMHQASTILLDVKNSVCTSSAFLAICVGAAQQAKVQQRQFGFLYPTADFKRLGKLFRLENIFPALENSTPA